MATVIRVPHEDAPHQIDGSACWCGAVRLKMDGGIVVCHRDNLGIALNLSPLILAERKE